MLNLFKRKPALEKLDLSLQNSPGLVASKISTAQIEMHPFPHLIVKDVLPTDLYGTALAMWPDRSTLPMEPGGLDRYMGHLISHGENSHYFGRYWYDFSETIGRLIVKSAMSKFSKFNEARFGKDVEYQESLAFFESGPGFEQHGPHTHHNHNPEWAMTFLLFMEDGGRTDRGEVFWAPPKDTPWLNIISGVTPVKPAKVIPFTPNTLLAWLDGPMSFHGTDKLARDATRRRRIFRCHVNLHRKHVPSVLGGTTVAEFFAATQAHNAGNSIRLKSILERGTSVDKIPRFDYAD